MYTTRTACRVCPDQITLQRVLDLGVIPVSTFVHPADPTSISAPLTLGLCPTCTLVQLMSTVKKEQLFQDQYWYRSGVNERMKAELADVVLEASKRTNPQPTDYVLDVGANDGTLLKHYNSLMRSLHPIRVAFEPAKNLHEELGQHAELVRETFFPPESLAGLKAYCPQGMKIITSIAMFYDLDDPNSFVHGVKELLHADGVWVIQLQDLGGMLEAGAFDNICHEHLEYYTLHSLMQTLRHNDLQVYDLVQRSINGGSLRLYVGHKHPPPAWATVEGNQRVLAQLDREAQIGVLDGEDLVTRFKRFEHRIDHMKRQLQAAVKAFGTVDGYGASTKGNTLLPVCGLGKDHIRQIAERSPEKWGLETVGTRIPIVSEADWRADPAPATVVPIWQFRDAVLKREKEYLEAGGTFVFPLPAVELVSR